LAVAVLIHRRTKRLDAKEERARKLAKRGEPLDLELMERSRRGSVAARVAIGAMLVFALLLQGLLLSPAAASNAVGGIICAQRGTGSDAPDRDTHRHHGLCCILACAASGGIFVAATAGIVFFPPRAISTLEFASATFAQARSPAQFYSSPRGPPQAL
jgi:hypothetical protein